METETFNGTGERLDKTTEQLRVEDFMRSAGQLVRAVPDIPTPEERLLRARLILEEAIETVNALGFVITPKVDKASWDPTIRSVDRLTLVDELTPNLKGIVDGCCDLNVVSTGTLSSCGVADVGPMHEVLDANQKKFDGGYRDEHGKWRKGPDWQEPDIEGELMAQGWEGT